MRLDTPTPAPRRGQHCAVAAFFILLAAAPLGAQSVQGRLLEVTTHAPIEGAMVWLYDVDDARLHGALTSADGRFRLNAPAAGRYRLRAERIGFEVTTSPELELVAGETLEYELLASAEPVRLGEIAVEAGRRCVVRPEAGLAAARLWEEARKALAAAVWTEDHGAYRFTVLSYERELEPRTLRVRSEERASTSLLSRNPIRSRPADELAADGYIRPRPDDGWDIYAPDATALLSDAFLDGHCFRIATGSGESAGLVGLAFEPVRGTKRPDIAGVLWLDPVTGALRHLEVGYTRVPSELAGHEPRGRVEFDRLPNGAWYVSRWWIRAPMVAIELGGFGGLSQRRVRTAGLLEVGGEVTDAAELGGRRVARARRASLTGVVYDSTRATPLAGAEVFLSGTAHRAFTDSAGRFRIDDVPEGTYGAAFLHPRLDTLGIFARPREVALTPGTESEVRLAVPSAATLLAAACETDDAGVPTGSVIGSIRDASTGESLAGARVALRWSHFGVRGPAAPRLPVIVREEWEGVEVEADDRGGFRVCGLPAGRPIVARAAHGERTGKESTIRLARGETLELALEIADDTARSAPLLLDEITVTAEARVRNLQAAGFYDRKATTSGAFLDRREIEARSATQVSQLLRGMFGVRTRSADLGRVVVYMSGAERPAANGSVEICWPRVLVDGLVVWTGGVQGGPAFLDDMIHPADIEAVEVYRSDAELPARFGGAHSNCGVILFWTRSGLDPSATTLPDGREPDGPRPARAARDVP